MRVPSRPSTWRIAGVWMVVLALGLAVTGSVLAVFQARSFTRRLLTEAQREAAQIADHTRQRVHHDVAETLDRVVEHLRTGGPGAWQPPRMVPSWIDGVFAWDGASVRIIRPAKARTEALADLLAQHLASTEANARDLPGQPTLLHAAVDGTPVTLSLMRAAEADGADLVVAASIDASTFRSSLVEPLVASSIGLELVAADNDRGPWSQPLYGPMSEWSIQPAASFLLELRTTVRVQTMAHLAPTILAVATLLGAMWVLVRVMRREMKLAEMKANFVADVSHELKTPLALIHMFGETLQSGRVVSDEKRQEYYEIIARESTRLTNLIDNILDFSRIEAGGSAYVLRPVDIGEVVRETYDAYREQLDRSGFEHHLSIQRDLPRVDADRNAIAQALINLINNAVKYSRDERYLSIDLATDTRRDRHGVLISVHDRGIGIEPAERARIFEGFFR
ncbi:MAG: sensor histidine kinase, partial [Phycisphaerae bacterium]